MVSIAKQNGYATERSVETGIQTRMDVRTDTNGDAPTRTYLTHATLVLPDETVQDGALLIEDGMITEICPDAIHGHAREIDLEGDILMPGLVDMHSDAIEREMEPRSRSVMPLPHAVVQGDRKCALAGITTAFHALGFTGQGSGRRNNEMTTALARHIHARAPYSAIDNRVHCRFEMTSPAGGDFIKALVNEGVCTMVSLNNHTPGQGQWGDLEMFRKYLKENYSLSDAEVERIVAEKMNQAQDAEDHSDDMAAFTLQARIPLASHDDEDSEKVAKRHTQGITITEFPLSFDAARKARDLNIHAIVGSPNVMRGGSTGSGERAIDLIAEGLAGCLCSDYAPSTLLPATFQIMRELDWPLHRAAPVSSANPARASWLNDRGEIRVGKRADLIAVRENDGVPVVRKLWSAGLLALSCR